MRWILALGCAAALVGCSDDAASDGGGSADATATGATGGSASGGAVICEPGSTVDCSCPGDPPSVRTCNAAGTAYGPCECPGMTSLPPMGDSSSSGAMTTIPPMTTMTTMTTDDTTTDDDGTTSTGTGTGTSTGSGTGTGTDSGTDAGTDSGSSGSGTTGGGMAMIQACDPWAPACPNGEGCKPYSTAGDGAYDANGCFAISPNPAQVGDVCTPASLGSGEDGCDIGLACFYVDAMGDGLCVEQCIGSAMNPICMNAGESCGQFSGGVLNVCLPDCDPLMSNCPGGTGCYNNNGGGWSCLPDGSGAGGAALDPCTSLNGCDPGHVCLDGSQFSACPEIGCCSPICDVSFGGADAMCAGLDPATSCEPWYAPGMAPPGLEDVGVCASPV